MEEDDEIDVLGDFNLESFLTKNEDAITSCYDGDHHLGLHCESPWVLDTPPQGSWYENKSDPHQSSDSALESDDINTWTDKEKYLLEKGLELFGRSWSRLAQYIGTKTAKQVKSYMKDTGWIGKSSGSTSSFGLENIDVNFSELINDMDIPASMEEVIAVVSTAQPTVVLPTTHRAGLTMPSSNSTRKWRSRPRKNTAFRTKDKKVDETPKRNICLYNAEDIKGVLSDNKEDHIVLPNGEQVIRIRYGTSLSDESDVDIDVDSDEEKVKDELILEENNSLNEEAKQVKEEIITDGEYFQFKEEVINSGEYVQCKETVFNYGEYDQFKEEVIDSVEYVQSKEDASLVRPLSKKEDSKECFFTNISNEVSQNVTEQRQKYDKKEVFKGSVVTPSGKIMTIVVDDLPVSSNDIGVKPRVVPSSKYLSIVQEGVNKLPSPPKENIIDRCIVTEEEKLLHPEFFSKNNAGRQKYLKIRNNIIDYWEYIKPTYASEKSVKYMLRSSVDKNVITKIYSYLNQKGYINFGCVEENVEAASKRPSSSNKINSSVFTEEEIRLHCEFFPKGGRRGPKHGKVLKIRNAIIDYWENIKPQYVSEKSIRYMLRNCGDDDLVTRIHYFLEQTGCINFRHGKRNDIKTRPQTNLINTGSDAEGKVVDHKEHSVSTTTLEIQEGCRARKRKLHGDEVAESDTSEIISKVIKKDVKNRRCLSILSPRPHTKKDTRAEDAGGYTTDSEELVKTSLEKVEQEPMKPVKLIHCKTHSVKVKAPYRVELEVSALILVDVHSHLSPKCEVIGLLGGKYRPDNGGVLSITVAVPCRTIVSSNIHCDMCPVSQLESSETITDKGLSVVGWYHSHPEFDPSPSDTDIDTQNMLQSWFNKTGNPFVGLIISPYFTVHRVSSYRCCHVIKDNRGLSPYKLDITLTKIDHNFGLLRKSIQTAYEALQRSGSFKPSIEFFKCLDSIKHHMTKVGVKEDKMAHIINEVRNFLKLISVGSPLVS